MKEDIVIRPSGVWNSRAPLNNYVQYDRSISKSVSIATISIYLLRQKLSHEDDKNRSARQLLREITKESAAGGKAWLGYRRAHGNDPNRRAIQPTVAHAWQDSHFALEDAQEMAIIRLSSMFEAFTQCWALNYLLAKLEGGMAFSRDERNLAIRFLPLVAKGRIPGWPQILGCIHGLGDQLSSLPHLFTNPKTGEKVVEPLSPTLNALAAIQFWRSYRNMAIHSSRVVTRPFYEKHSHFFAEAMECFGHIRKLEPGKPLPFKDDLYGAMAAAHFKAALFMNDALERLSSGRRGHPEAPKPKETIYWSIPPKSPALLMKGDHLPSYLWIADKDYRARLSKENGWIL